MKDYTAFTVSFFDRFGADYTAEAIASLTADMAKVAANPVAASRYRAILDAYESTDRVNRDEMNQAVREVASLAGIGEKASLLLQFILLTEHMEVLYRKNSMDEQIYIDSVRDLSFKNRECQDVYREWGLFTDWFVGFLHLTLFAVGRLQYQLDKYNKSDVYTKSDVTLKRGETPALSIHIPSDGRLTTEKVYHSFQYAYQTFPEYRQNGKLVLQCSSWLLYPKMHDFMTPGSNLCRFEECFDILSSSEDPKFGNCWRLFGVYYTGDPKVLPRDTTLRRQYAEFLENGGIAGGGSGVILFDGNEIVR